MLSGSEAQTSTKLVVFGSRVVLRCQAKSKRSEEQCCKAAMRGKAVCRTHGGVSTGPKTAIGRRRCAAAKTVHGREGRAARAVRAEKLRELRELEGVMAELGMFG